MIKQEIRHYKGTTIDLWLEKMNKYGWYIKEIITYTKYSISGEYECTFLMQKDSKDEKEN